MSPASYLTAPPRVARPILAPCRPAVSNRGSIGRVVVWVALAVWGVLVVVGVAFAGLRGFQLYRQARRTGERFDPALEHLAAAGERIQVHLERAERSQVGLEGALGRLATSRARLQVQLDAIAEAKRAVNTILPVFGPR
jgi:hypothetical protein